MLITAFAAAAYVGAFVLVIVSFSTDSNDKTMLQQLGWLGFFVAFAVPPAFFAWRWHRPNTDDPRGTWWQGRPPQAWRRLFWSSVATTVVLLAISIDGTVRGHSINVMSVFGPIGFGYFTYRIWRDPLDRSLKAPPSREVD